LFFQSLQFFDKESAIYRGRLPSQGNSLKEALFYLACPLEALLQLSLQDSTQKISHLIK